MGSSRKKVKRRASDQDQKFYSEWGTAWRETDVEDTDLETVITDLLEGQYINPWESSALTFRKAGFATSRKTWSGSSANDVPIRTAGFRISWKSLLLVTRRPKTWGCVELIVGGETVRRKSSWGNAFVACWSIAPRPSAGRSCALMEVGSPTSPHGGGSQRVSVAALAPNKLCGA